MEGEELVNIWFKNFGKVLAAFEFRMGYRSRYIGL